MTDEEIRVQTLRLAVDSMYWEQSPMEKGSYGSNYGHKRMRDILDRSDAFFTYIKDPSANSPTGIIAKLRDVLCAEQAR